MSPRITQACALKTVHNKLLKYQTTILMQDLIALTKTTTMKYHRPERRTKQVKFYGGRLSKHNDSDAQDKFRLVNKYLNKLKFLTERTVVVFGFMRKQKGVNNPTNQKICVEYFLYKACSDSMFLTIYNNNTIL